MKYEIGNRIRYFRELRSLSQKELAARIGVSNSRVSNWEQGINRPDADMLVLLCQTLEVSADELLDMNTSNMRLTEDERQVIVKYRDKPDLHPAVHLLLGIEMQVAPEKNNKNTPEKNLYNIPTKNDSYLDNVYGEAAAFGGDSARIPVSKEALEELLRRSAKDEL